MKNLHLLIIGSTEEALRANVLSLLEEALESHRLFGDKASSLIPSTGEFEFTNAEYMVDIRNEEHGVHQPKVEQTNKHKLKWEYCECGCKCHTALSFSLFNDLEGGFHLFLNHGCDRKLMGKFESFELADKAASDSMIDRTDRIKLHTHEM